jgi:transcriptional regulator with XRE-family HTH domain
LTFLCGQLRMEPMAIASARTRRAKIGARLRALREKCGMKPVEFARELDLSQPSIRNWETGRTSPSLDKLPRIAEVLKADLAELYALYGVSGSAFRRAS